MAYFKNALLLDDDEVALYLHQIWLKNYNLAEHIISCRTTKEALSYVEKNGFGITTDLLLLDIHMPVMNGFEFMEELFSLPNSLGKHAYLFLLTSSTSSMDTNIASLFPLKGYLQKPLGPEQVEYIIATLGTNGVSDRTKTNQ